MSDSSDTVSSVGLVNLNGVWELRFGPQVMPAATMSQPEPGGDYTTIPANVPGNVELDLVRAGLLPPSLEKGDNIYGLRDFETYQWWYSRDFVVEELVPDTTTELVFEGVDTLASVWLNGQRVAGLDNMLIPHRIDVSGMLRGGTNQIVVGIDSAVMAAHAKPVEAGSWAMENNWESLSIRKAAHGYGWDIMPRVVSAGIWRDVYIDRLSSNRFRDVYLATSAVDPDARRAGLVVRWDIATVSWPIDAWSVRVGVHSMDGDLVAEKVVPVLTTHGLIEVELEDVDLWWPRGLGDAPLYTVSLELLDEHGTITADWKSRFGFRTVRLELTDTTNGDGDGRFEFVVNGLPVFVKGSNWVPLDAFHSRDRERVNETLDLVADLNCMMIRCWGGNVYESDEFFRLCDEKGIMVWQDFAFACALYPQTSEFHGKVRAEAEAIIPRLRNHPSIVLWAGNNEIDAFYTFAKPTCDPNVDDVISREILASACRRLDPWRDYLPSSPYFGPELWRIGAPHDRRPEDHLWGPRDDFKGDFYLSSNAHFVSEIGYHGCPSRSSLEKMMSDGKLWPWQENEDWLTHAVRPQRRGEAYNYRISLMANQIKVLFGLVPEDLEDFIFASQFSQAEALKFFIERFRIRKGRFSGILWWNIRDGWPQISDAIVDYYGVRKLAYDVVRRVQQDVCVMLDEPVDGVHGLVAVNDTRHPVDVEMSIKSDGSEILRQNLRLSAGECSRCAHVAAPDHRQFLRIAWECGGQVFNNHYLAGPRPFDVAACREWYRGEGIDLRD